MRSRSSQAVFAVLESYDAFGHGSRTPSLTTNRKRLIGTTKAAHGIFKTVNKYKKQAAVAVATYHGAKAVFRYGEKKVMVRNPAMARDHAATAKAYSKIHADKAVKATNPLSRRWHTKRTVRLARGAKRYSKIADIGDKKAAYHNRKIRKGLRRYAAVSEGLKTGLAKAVISSVNPIAHISLAKKIGTGIGKKIVGK